MNFLAHLYLSHHDHDLMIGNFIADAIRKVQWKEYTPEIIKGIEMHHFIDDFTDTHEVVKESKARLYKDFRKYAPVIVDVFYDHFLAKNWEHYHPQKLQDFTAAFYALTNSRKEGLPEHIQNMLPYMISNDWLYNYSKIEGINKSLTGMSRRSKFDNNMDLASKALEEHLDAFKDEFERFFPELEAGCKNWLLRY
jgi:acyl carrier protein phosphodiesterase